MLAAQRFDRLLEALALSADERAAGTRAHETVRTALTRHYYRFGSIASHSLLIGAWGKGTDIRPPRDIDVLFILPPALDEAAGGSTADENGPLGHLHDVKEVLAAVVPDTHLRRNGRAVLASFDDASVEVSVGFSRRDSCCDLCDASDGGRYRLCCPAAEYEALDASDRASRGATRDLIRLMKCWQASRAVPLSSFAIELVAMTFLDTWPQRTAGGRFYDWMVRDFLAFLLTRARTSLSVPGLGTDLALGAAWEQTALLAHKHASLACEFEVAGRNTDAWWEWEKIFGEIVPFADTDDHSR